MKTLKSWFSVLSRNHVEFFLLSGLLCVLSQRSWVADPHRTFDSIGYLALTDISIFNPDFWFGVIKQNWYGNPMGLHNRPPGLSLILKVTGSGVGFILFQSLLYTFSWIFLYRTLKIINKDIYKDLLLCVFILLVSVFFNKPFFHYNFMILTESISFSCLLVILSLFLRFTINKCPLFLLKIIPVLVLFSLLRDVNTFIAFLIVLSSFFLFIPKKKFSVFLVLLTVSLVNLSFSTFTVNKKSHGMNQRWIFPMFNNYGKRMMAHKDWDNFSKNNQIPFFNDTDVLSIKNKIQETPLWTGWWGGYFLEKGPWGKCILEKVTPEKRESLKNWFLSNSRKTYLKFLLSYPLNTIKIIFRPIRYFIFSVESQFFYIFFIMFFWICGRWSRVIRKTSDIKSLRHHPVCLFCLSLLIISGVSVCFSIIFDATELIRHSLVPLLITIVALIGLGIIDIRKRDDI